MVNASDLRIGNILDVLNESGVISQDTGYNWTVVELRRDSVILEKKGIAELQTSCERLSLITLTEEWLNRCLFQCKPESGWDSSDDENYDVYSLNKVQLIIKDSKVLLWNEVADQHYNFYSLHFKYLHELQNYYQLSEKQELTIKEVI